MSQQYINIGSTPNDGLGDPIRTAFQKTNDNFSQLFPVANVITVIGNGIAVNGNISGNYFIGNGSLLTGISSTYGNANVANYLPTFSGNLTSLNTITASGNVNANNLLGNSASVLGNVTANRIFANAGISSTGNITTAGFFIGTFQGNITGNLTVPGLNTQVLYNNSGNAGASAGFTFDAASNAMTVAGNVTTRNILPGANVAYDLGSPSQQWRSLYISGNTIYIGSTNISASGSNLTIGNNNVVVANTPMTGDVLTSGIVSAAGNIYGDELVSTGINAANIYGTNISVSGNIISNTISSLNISASGNVRGTSILTGYVSSTGNIRGGNLNTSGIVTATGNISGGNLTTVGMITATGNIRGGNLTTVGMITATGNVYGNYIIGNGALLTNINAGNITGSYGNANVAEYLPTFSGNLTAGNISASGNIRVSIVLSGGISSSGNIRGGNINTAGIVTATGNVIGGNIKTSGLLTTTGTFRLPSYTSAQIANIAAVVGDMVYNTTVNQIQGYQANATGSLTWVSLNIPYYR